jgi:two-component system, NarL family, invasion response regulator UvrY
LALTIVFAEITILLWKPSIQLMPNIALVDDHTLLRKGLAQLIESLGHKIQFQAENGKEFIDKLSAKNRPNLVLMDINMPVMDGYETTEWLREQHPQVPVLALSMYDNEASIIRMLKMGAKGYLLKDCDPSELATAINNVLTKGYHYTDLVYGRLLHAINDNGIEKNGSLSASNLSDKEMDFLRLICTELTYREIADQLCLSPRTVDGYRDILFEKLNVKTRIGLVIYSIKNNLIHI